MAKAYVCDACGETMTDPYSVRMKEFYIGRDCTLVGVFPAREKRKVKVHLCDDCYKGLHLIAEGENDAAD